jgi:ABC-2 type transport system ATP-binding protein
MITIEAHGLTKAFGPVRAVDDLSFTARPGRVTGFLGPNGAGKTTTLRMVLGLVRPDAGTASLAGRTYRDPRQSGAHRRCRVDLRRVPPGAVGSRPPTAGGDPQ